MSRKVVKHKWQYVKNGQKDRLYNVYVHMCQRCYYDKYKFFHRYGGRGIIVCEEWLIYQSYYDNVDHLQERCKHYLPKSKYNNAKTVVK